MATAAPVASNAPNSRRVHEGSSTSSPATGLTKSPRAAARPRLSATTGPAFGWDRTVARGQPAVSARNRARVPSREPSSPETNCRSNGPSCASSPAQG